mgnify:CR=1 FL=1
MMPITSTNTEVVEEFRQYAFIAKPLSIASVTLVPIRITCSMIYLSLRAENIIAYYIYNVNDSKRIYFSFPHVTFFI